MSDTAKRLAELSERADKRGIWTFSDFLTLAEQEELKTLRLPSPCALEGGWPRAERRVAVFGSEEAAGYPAETPIVCLLIEPKSRKFADTLTHRDFLGSLMGLGVRREMLGDIVVADNAGYLFCLESVEGYIAAELSEVRRTAVRVTRLDTPPELEAILPEPATIVAASERLDALISGVYDLPRSESQRLIAQGLVSVNGREAESGSAQVSAGEIVSVRGLGRFSYEGAEGETRKGRLRARVRRY